MWNFHDVKYSCYYEVVGRGIPLTGKSNVMSMHIYAEVLTSNLLILYSKLYQLVCDLLGDYKCL